MKEPVDFGNEDWFIGEDGDGVEAVDFYDIRVIVVETVVKIEIVNVIKY